jgi:hypothetical protein
MSKVMNEVVHESQIAYIAERYVHNIIRSLKLIKQLCNEQKRKEFL